jgi:trans-2,3-dihydro-3-hydroxyanthranilate isomerase
VTSPSAAPHEYVVADVFTGTPLEGNPVAVFLDAGDLSARRMQRIAGEMHLSETTFVLPAENGGDARIRIFTPVNELPFAGHPMLGTAIVLGGPGAREEIRLETAMGTVPFAFEHRDGEALSARMRQPVPTWTPYAEARDLLAALGLESSTLPVEVYRNGPRHVYVGLENVPALSRVEPDLRALAKHPDVAVNCFAGAGRHWRMRMFSPAYGVAEDAATGSAAGPLAVHLVRHGLISAGDRIEIVQGVEIGRPSTMIAETEGTGERFDAVEVAGSAVVVAKGTLTA